MADLQDMQIVDPGIDENIAKLTPDRIEKTINRVLTDETGARLQAYIQTCVHCGLCAESCQSYVSRNKDPDYAPVAKVKDTIWEMVKRKGKVDGEFLHNAARIAFLDCGACRRCSMYCPFGIDISYMIMTVRRILNLLGVVPQYLQDTTNSHSATMNQMWVQQDDWIDTLMWQEEDAQAEIPGTRIPLDKSGADIMYSIIGPEPKILAQLIANMAMIFKVADADWTMPSTDGWDNSNMAMYSGDFETMGRVERLHWDRAIQLKVKRVVMGECGHAYRGAVYDGPRWLGWTQPPTRSSTTTTSSRAGGSRSRARSKNRSRFRIPATSSAAAVCTKSCGTWSTPFARISATWIRGTSTTTAVRLEVDSSTAVHRGSSRG